MEDRKREHIIESLKKLDQKDIAEQIRELLRSSEDEEWKKRKPDLNSK